MARIFISKNGGLVCTNRRTFNCVDDEGHKT